MSLTWAYSAFGENEPTTVRHRFAEADKQASAGTTSFAPFGYGKRHDGMQADTESGLSQRTAGAPTIRAAGDTQVDPIGLAGGWNRIPYVGGNPLSFSGPMGLDRWSAEAWAPALVYTDMSDGTTTYFDPMTLDLLVISTRNAVAPNALPGAADPYNGEFTYCEHPNSKE